MNRFFLILFFGLGITALKPSFLVSAKTQQSSLEERRQQCIGWMMSDYPSGIQELSCVSEFSLPSAFLFKCARAEKRGYKDELQRNACSLFFAQASKSAHKGYVIN